MHSGGLSPLEGVGFRAIPRIQIPKTASVDSKPRPLRAVARTRGSRRVIGRMRKERLRRQECRVGRRRAE
eukprot:2352184-Pyramimonas_sp.AAC.1